MTSQPWDRQPGETAKSFAAFVFYRDLPGAERSVQAAITSGRKEGARGTHRGWQRWAARYDWQSRAGGHDSDLASRRRERMAKELERAQDGAVVLVRAALAKVAERIAGLDAEELAAGQIPAALKTLIELEFKALGKDDRLELAHEGKVEVDTTADAAWLLDYLRGLPERSGDDSEPEG